jgi:hypothetical protein
MAAELVRLSTERQAPGFALVWPSHGSPSLVIPAPFDVEFEPVLLDERSQSLESLCTGLLEWHGGRAPPVSKARRHVLRYGIPIALGVYAGGYFMLDLAGNVSLAGFFIGAACIAAITLVVVCLLVSRQWLIAPGAVIVGSPSWLPWGGAEVYTPRDSVLVLRQTILGWEATIWRWMRRRVRSLTELEAVALLGAWQAECRDAETDCA